MAFESRVESLVSKEKSPLVALRAMAHIVAFYPPVHFVHLCYLQIIVFYTPFELQFITIEFVHEIYIYHVIVLKAEIAYGKVLTGNLLHRFYVDLCTSLGK